jgi:glycosyltransferase involved in cell wall biosynthesis
LKKIKVAHLTSVHDAIDGRIFYKECRTLAQAGYVVVLIGPHPRDEILDQVQIRGIPKPKNRPERMVRTTSQILRAALKESADIYHFHDVELIPAGLLLTLLGKRVFYDVHEDVPKQILSKHWILLELRALVSHVVGAIECLGGLAFEGIVASTPAIAKRFPSKKAVAVQNFPILENHPCPKLNSYATRPAIIAYVGGMTAIRGIKEMVEATTLIPASLHAKLLLAGSCDPELETDVRNMQTLECIEFLGWQSPKEVTQLLRQSRVGLVLYHPVPNHFEAQPTKLFQYMYAGVPVVASDFPLWRDIVNGTGCGLVVDPLDPKAIAAAIQRILEHPKEAEEMGLCGLRAVQARFNWNSEGKTLLDLYRKVLNGSQARLRLS